MANIVTQSDISSRNSPFLFRWQRGEERLKVKGAKRIAIGKDASRLGFNRDLNRATGLFVERMQSTCQLPPLPADLLDLRSRQRRSPPRDRQRRNRPYLSRWQQFMEKLDQIPSVLQSRWVVPSWTIDSVLDDRLMKIALREPVQGEDAERLGRQEMLELFKRSGQKSLAGGDFGEPKPQPQRTRLAPRNRLGLELSPDRNRESAQRFQNGLEVPSRMDIGAVPSSNRARGGRDVQRGGSFTRTFVKRRDKQREKPRGRNAAWLEYTVD